MHLLAIVIVDRALRGKEAPKINASSTDSRTCRSKLSYVTLATRQQSQHLNRQININWFCFSLGRRISLIVITRKTICSDSKATIKSFANCNFHLFLYTDDCDESAPWVAFFVSQQLEQLFPIFTSKSTPQYFDCQLQIPPNSSQPSEIISGTINSRIFHISSSAAPNEHLKFTIHSSHSQLVDLSLPLDITSTTFSFWHRPAARANIFHSNTWPTQE